jgi:hypothetical protein
MFRQRLAHRLRARGQFDRIASAQSTATESAAIMSSPTKTSIAGTIGVVRHVASWRVHVARLRDARCQLYIFAA